MSKLSKIRQLLRQKAVWKTYKKRYKHAKMRLLLSKLTLDLKPEVDLVSLANEEAKLAQISLSAVMFEEAFIWLGHELGREYNWAALGRYVFYLFQMSTARRDLKNAIANVYAKPLNANTARREHYYTWLHSIPLSTFKYNHFIQRVMRHVF